MHAGCKTAARLPARLPARPPVDSLRLDAGAGPFHLVRLLASPLKSPSLSTALQLHRPITPAAKTARQAQSHTRPRSRSLGPLLWLSLVAPCNLASPTSLPPPGHYSRTASTWPVRVAAGLEGAATTTAPQLQNLVWRLVSPATPSRLTAFAETLLTWLAGSGNCVSWFWGMGV
ncbi:hypothetical protein EDB80DRAFT_187716 [Ilyonectria destructans]|nr:hypothetical protein EDB80DRAFT_187716 [Ilyonectria destructans]